MLSVAADVTATGRLFHTRAAATGKARSLTVEKRVGGTTRALVCQELKQAAIPWRSIVVPDHGDSDKQVEQACT